MKKLVKLCFALILLLSITSAVFGEDVNTQIDDIRIRMIIGSSTSLLENAVVGDQMGEYNQEAIDTYKEVMDNYLEALNKNLSENEMLTLEEELTEAYRIFTGSRNANQSELNSYNKYLTDAKALFDGVAVGYAVGDVSPDNHQGMMTYLEKQSLYEEGTVVQLATVRSKDEDLSQMITEYLVYNDKALEAPVVETPVVEAPELVEEPEIVEEAVVDEVIAEEPVVEEMAKEESIPQSIVDLVTTDIEPTAEALEVINKEIVVLIQDAEKLTDLSGDQEAGQALFSEIIVPIGSHYNKLDLVEAETKEIMNESISLANITIALSGDVKLDAESLIIEEDEVILEPTVENLLLAVLQTESTEKAIEELMRDHLDEGLEDAVVSTLNIAVPETLKNIPKTKISLPETTVNLLSDSDVERVNLDMGNINFGINDKFLNKHEDTSFEFFVERQAPLMANEMAGVDESAEAVDVPIYDLGANQNENRGDAFKHPMSLSFDLRKASESLEENEIFVVYRLNEESGEWQAVSGFYNEVTGTITVSRLHLSKYTVLKSEKNFTNIEDSWAKNEIAALKSNGVIKETELFKPQDAITREEFASWVVTAYGLDSETIKSEFIDLDEGSPYFQAVTVAYEHGIVMGDSDGSFKPKDDITKAELAFMIASAMDQYEYTVDTETFDLAKYEKDLPMWAVEAVETVVENGLVEEAYFGTASVVTKEEAAAILYQVHR